MVRGPAAVPRWMAALCRAECVPCAGIYAVTPQMFAEHLHLLWAALLRAGCWDSSHRLGTAPGADVPVGSERVLRGGQRNRS